MKKIMTIALAAAMCMSMTVSALAQVPSIQDEVKPRGGPLCDECGKGEMQAFTEYSSWVLVDYAPCHLNDDTHTDKVYERDVTRGRKCNYCGVTIASTSTETKYVCQ